jgi:hypothetical protein
MKMLKDPKMIKLLMCIGLSTKAAFCFSKRYRVESTRSLLLVLIDASPKALIRRLNEKTIDAENNGREMVTDCRVERM